MCVCVRRLGDGRASSLELRHDGALASSFTCASILLRYPSGSVGRAAIRSNRMSVNVVIADEGYDPRRYQQNLDVLKRLDFGRAPAGDFP